MNRLFEVLFWILSLWVVIEIIIIIIKKFVKTRLNIGKDNDNQHNAENE